MVVLVSEVKRQGTNDKRKKEDRISGLRYAIEQVEDRIKNDPNRPPGVFEEQLESLRAQLEEAIKNR